MMDRRRLALIVSLLTIAAVCLGASSAQAIPLKTFSISDAQVVEGSGGGCSGAGVVFTVTRTWKGDKPHVTVSTNNTGTADSSNDYQPGSYVANFKGGKTSTQVTIPVCQDTDVEPDETFGVILENPSTGYTIVTGSATGTIVNDDVCTPGAPGCGWESGDLVTFQQGGWGDTSGTAATLLVENFNSIYFATAGLEVGTPGPAGFSMRFTDASDVTAYLPATGTPGPLTSDLVNPTTSASGVFGGEVVTLKLNVDFSDADLTGGTAPFPFGDVLICGASPLANMTIRNFLGVANTALGGGSTGYAISDLNTIAAQLNASFFDGPSTWAQEQLFSGACP